MPAKSKTRVLPPIALAMREALVAGPVQVTVPGAEAFSRAMSLRPGTPAGDHIAESEKRPSPPCQV